MEAFKPLYLRTYGKRIRKVSAWITPDKRRRAFDSSESSASDGSVFEPPKAKKKTSKKTTSGRGTRRARAKAKAVVNQENSVENTDDTAPSGDGKSVGRYVTCRKRPAPTKARKMARQAPRPSNTQSSVQGRQTITAAKPLKEIFLNNELSDCSPRLCSRKPLFCSTPSAVSCSTRPSPKQSPIDQQVADSESDSIGCIAPSSSLHKDVDSQGEMATSHPPVILNLIANQSDAAEPQKEQTPDQCDEPADVCLRTTTVRQSSNTSKDLSCKTRQEDTPAGPQPPSLLSTHTDDSSSRFVSATAELVCDAQEERLSTEPDKEAGKHPPSLQSVQTTYSSCFETSSRSFGRRAKESELSKTGHRLEGPMECTAPSLHMHLSEINDDTGGPEPSVHNCESPQPAPGSADTKKHLLPSPELFPSSQHTAHHALSDPLTECEPIADSPEARAPLMVTIPVRSCCICLRRLPLSEVKRHMRQRQPVEDTTDLGSAERIVTLTETLKNECLTRKCVVAAKRTPSAELRLVERVTSNRHTVRPTSRQEMETEMMSQQSPPRLEAGEPAEPKRRKPPTKDKKRRRSPSTDRPLTARKACVSGLSVSRWKNSRANTSTLKHTRAIDCSINDMFNTRHMATKYSAANIGMSSPPRESSSPFALLAALTPSSHTWSRLKAALSVHRKVFCTPTSLLSAPGSPTNTGLEDMSRDLFATPVRTPLPKRIQSQLLSTTSQIVFEDADLSDAEKVYAECGQQGALPWEECILPQRMRRCVKIGEGTFGEVFSTIGGSGDTVALKVIPVEGSQRVNGEEQKTFGEILHEIIISKELSSLKEKQCNQTHGFIGLTDLHCVRGRYPDSFLVAWDDFDNTKGSENDRPDFFEETQLFLILEFEFGGVDLENSNGTLSSLSVAKSVLHQVTAALAVAEQELQFEHRDLHWGNVLVKTTRQKRESFLLMGKTHSLETRGVVVRIIDYSLSRLAIDGLTVSCDISKDEELFMGQGDYQFDIYRLMRQENGNEWSSYQPHTNVLWLHYLCSKLLSMKYRGNGGRVAKDVREELVRFYDNILQYRSATEVLQNYPMFQ